MLIIVILDIKKIDMFQKGFETLNKILKYHEKLCKMIKYAKISKRLSGEESDKHI